MTCWLAGRPGWLRELGTSLDQKRSKNASSLDHKRSENASRTADWLASKQCGHDANQRKSTQINGNQRKSTEINANQRKSTEINANQRKSTQINGWQGQKLSQAGTFGTSLDQKRKWDGTSLGQKRSKSITLSITSMYQNERLANQRFLRPERQSVTLILRASKYHLTTRTWY